MPSLEDLKLTSETARKTLLVYLFSVVGLVTFVVFGLINLRNGEVTAGVLEIGLGYFTFLNAVFLRYTKKLEIASSTMMLILSLALIFLFQSGGIERTGFLWFYTYPAIAYFLKGKKEGTIWVGLLLLVIIFMSLLSYFKYVQLPYNFVELRQFVSSLVVVSILIYVYEFISDMKDRLLEKRTVDLESLAEQLEDEVKQRKKAEEAVEKRVEERTKELAETQAKLQASINSLNVGFMMTNTKNEIVNINSTAKRLLCVGEYNKLIRNFDKRYLSCSIEDIEKQLEGILDLRSSLKQCLEERKIVDIKEVNFQEKILHFFLSPIALYREKLDVIGVVILVEDITEEKVLDRSKDEFFSIASHELRTPLTAIRGNTSMIKEFYWSKLKDKDLKEMVEDIHDSTIRLIQIVNDFLDTSRLEQGRIEFHNENFKMEEIVEGVFKELTANANAAKVYLKNESKGKIPAVVADPNRVKQVLINLVGNALKFTEKGGVTVRLEANDVFVKVSVIDTGKGIPASNLKLLFRKFQQAENNILTRDSTRGTGLGLYISKLLVEGMGGKIYIESSVEGKGTTFAFELPAVVGSSLKVDAKKEPAKTP